MKSFIAGLVSFLLVGGGTFWLVLATGGPATGITWFTAVAAVLVVSIVATVTDEGYIAAWLSPVLLIGLLLAGDIGAVVVFALVAGALVAAAVSSVHSTPYEDDYRARHEVEYTRREVAFTVPPAYRETALNTHGLGSLSLFELKVLLASYRAQVAPDAIRRPAVSQRLAEELMDAGVPITLWELVADGQVTPNVARKLSKGRPAPSAEEVVEFFAAEVSIEYAKALRPARLSEVTQAWESGISAEYAAEVLGARR